jgi:iron(III) transport system substrate-binding protein
MIAEMDPQLRAVLPDADIKWYQAGSENVASKVNTEMAAGATKADLILTSDPFWYHELKKTGKLLPYESAAAKAVPAQYRDPEHYWINVRMPVMVIAYNSEAVKEADAPKSFKDLADPKWKGKLTMGSPLESGTMFTTVALLSRKYGWDYFQALRKNDIVAAGGNSSVINRVETRERPIGIVLIENVLKAQAKNSPVKLVYPSDGTIPIPSPIAILKDSKNPELVKKAYDWFFTPEAQKAVVKGGMYAAVPGIAGPDTALGWPELEKNLAPWSPALVDEIYAQRDQLKSKFSEVVFH